MLTNNRMKLFEDWDTTLKVPSLFLLMMSMAFIRDQRLMFLLPSIAAILFTTSGIKLSLLLSRFRAPVLFLLFVSVFLILFSEGETLFRIGPFALKSRGVTLALNTSVRVLCIITVGIVMVNTTPLAGLSGKLQKMRIPKILVDIGILTGRYIMVIGEDFRKMRASRKLRGYVPGKSISQRFRVIVPTAATLLLRGFQQSEMVFNAMHMRGYGNTVSSTAVSDQPERPSRFNMIMFFSTLAMSAVLIVLEISLEAG